MLNRAVDADAEAAALRARIDVERQGGARMFVSHLAGVGGLRDGLSVDEAVDMCWILMNPLLQAPSAHRARLDPRGGGGLAGPDDRPPRCSPTSVTRPRVTGMAETRWEQARAQERAEGQGGYGAHFARLIAEGVDIEGEARLADVLAPRGGWILG